MALHMVRRWRRALAVTLGAALMLACAVAPSTAQPGESDPVHHTRSLSFYIPFTSDPQDAHRIRQLHLHVSEDNGKTYQYAVAASPTEQKFRFTARRDGTYWFVVQTQDINNQLNPPTNQVAQTPPNLKVIVDTRKPQIDLKQGQARQGEPVAVEWTITEDYLDTSSLKLEYRPAGGRDWFPLPIVQQNPGGQGWDPKINGRVEVRLQARDKAGNNAEATISILPTGVNPTTAGTGTGVGSVSERQQDNLFYVNSTKFNLDYQVENEGKSGVKHVEIWRTNDLGRSWVIYRPDAPPQSPFPIEVAGQGRYGLTVVAVSGAGLAGPRPRNGDQPEVWIEVDTKKPDVRLIGVEPGHGADMGRLTITWSASDKNLSVQPIALSYAKGPEGPWEPIAQNLPNDGKYVWMVPENHPFQFYVRVEATDMAKNVGMDTTPKPVAVDTKIPKARIKGVGVGVQPEPGTGAKFGVTPAQPEAATPTPGAPTPIPPGQW